jgi:signal transduction histidine kinase
VIILVVDDYAANRKLLRTTLEAEGHRVLEATNGLEALRLLEHEPVDAVISDVLMPSMDGFRLCHEIRKSTKLNTTVPIVLYTATYNSAADRELSETVGADGFLLKPAPTEAILVALGEARLKAKRRKTPVGAQLGDAYVLEQYSAALVRKLESRNSELQQALDSRRIAHEHILELNRTLEARVARRTAALDSANKELEAFSYSVSHDLRAPLRHISGYADLLADTAGAVLEAESADYLSKIRESAKHMDQLILDLLEFARMSRVELDLVDVDLEVLLEEALAAMHSDVQGRNIQWQRARLPKVRGDAALLRQVFINVLSNAVKYTKTRSPAVIEIGSREGRAGEVTLFVSDNGVGFDMRYAPKLFGVFSCFARRAGWPSKRGDSDTRGATGSTEPAGSWYPSLRPAIFPRKSTRTRTRRLSRPSLFAPSNLRSATTWPAPIARSRIVRACSHAATARSSRCR